jgi:hypothetical protein
MSDTDETTARANLLHAVCAENAPSIGAAARLWGIPCDTVYQATAGRRVTYDLLLRVAEQAKADGPASVYLREWAQKYRDWRVELLCLEMSRPSIWPWGLL